MTCGRGPVPKIAPSLTCPSPLFSCLPRRYDGRPKCFPQRPIHNIMRWANKWVCPGPQIRYSRFARLEIRDSRFAIRSVPIRPEWEMTRQAWRLLNTLANTEQRRRWVIYPSIIKSARVSVVSSAHSQMTGDDNWGISSWRFWILNSDFTSPPVSAGQGYWIGMAIAIR